MPIQKKKRHSAAVKSQLDSDSMAENEYTSEASAGDDDLADMMKELSHKLKKLEQENETKSKVEESKWEKNASCSIQSAIKEFCVARSKLWETFELAMSRFEEKQSFMLQELVSHTESLKSISLAITSLESNLVEFKERFSSQIGDLSGGYRDLLVQVEQEAAAMEAIATDLTEM